MVQRHLQLPAGQRSEIIASGVYAQLPVLMCESGERLRSDLQPGQGMFAVKSVPQPDGRIRLELVPELHHDLSRASIGWAIRACSLRLDLTPVSRIAEAGRCAPS